MDLLKTNRTFLNWALAFTIIAVSGLFTTVIVLVVKKQDSTTMDETESQVSWGSDRVPLKLIYGEELEMYGPSIVQAARDLNDRAGCQIVDVIHSGTPDLILTADPQIILSHTAGMWKVFVDGVQFGVAAIQQPKNAQQAYLSTLHHLGHMVGLGDDDALGSVMNLDAEDSGDLSNRLSDEDAAALNARYCH
jgi:hypothetical protein